MPLSRPNADRLVSYLSQLSPDVAVFLIREIELHRFAGRDDPVYDAILNAAREVVRASERSIQRVTTPLRLFCIPFRDLLVDQTWGARQKGRVSRTSIMPVWHWLIGGHAPDDLTDLAAAIETEARRDDAEAIDGLQRQLAERVGAAIGTAMQRASESDKAEMRLQAQLGGRFVLRDAVTIGEASRAFEAIERLRERLPKSLADLDGEESDLVIAEIADFIGTVPDTPEFAFACILDRCASPSEALRLATRDVKSTDASRLAESRYAPLGNLILCDIEIAARRVDAAVRDRAETRTLMSSLATFHKGASAFETEIDLNPRGDWALALSGARRIASEALNVEIRRIPELLTSLFRPYTARRRTPNLASPEPKAVADTVRALNLRSGVRTYLKELSLNEALMQVDAALGTRLDAIRDTVHEDLRHPAGAPPERVAEWFSAVVSMIGAANGPEEAALLARSGKVAAYASDPDVARPASSA